MCIRDSPQIEVIEADAQLIPKTLAEDAILVRSVYEIKINGIAGYMNLSVPYTFIGPHFARYSHNNAEMRDNKNNINKGIIGRKFGALSVPVSVEFDRKKIRAAEAASLAPGSIIVLNHPCSKPLNIKVNGKLKYFGTPGLKQKKMAVKILSSIEDEE